MRLVFSAEDKRKSLHIVWSWVRRVVSAASFFTRLFKPFTLSDNIWSVNLRFCVATDSLYSARQLNNTQHYFPLNNTNLLFLVLL